MIFRIMNDFRANSKASGKCMLFRKRNAAILVLLCIFGLFTVSCELSQEHAIEPKTEEVEVADSLKKVTNSEAQTRSGDPVAEFELDCNPCYVNTTITFTNLSVNATSYRWDFGDGNTSTDANPTHTYSTTGQKVITLTAFAKEQESEFIITQEILDT